MKTKIERNVEERHEIRRILNKLRISYRMNMMTYSKNPDAWLDLWVKWVFYARSLGYNDWQARKIAEKQMEIEHELVKAETKT